MKKVLLLGATGFIGSNVAKELSCQGRSWVGVARASRHCDNPILTLDDETGIRSILEERPVVINALGGLKPRDFEQNFEMAMEEFWRALQHVLGLIRSWPPSALLQISSAGTVYGEALRGPSKESDPPAPCSWYGRMKVVEEVMYQQVAKEVGITYTCARVTNPFGNEDHPTHGLVDVLIDHITRAEPFCARFDKAACRDFIHAPEMAKALIAMADRPSPGTFNVGRGQSTQLKPLVEFARSLSPAARIEFGEPSPSDVVKSEVSIDRFREAFGFSPAGPSAAEYLEMKLERVTA